MDLGAEIDAAGINEEAWALARSFGLSDLNSDIRKFADQEPDFIGDFQASAPPLRALCRLFATETESSRSGWASSRRPSRSLR